MWIRRNITVWPKVLTNVAEGMGMRERSELSCPEFYCLHASWYAAAGDFRRRDEELQRAAEWMREIAEDVAEALAGSDLQLKGAADRSRAQ